MNDAAACLTTVVQYRWLLAPTLLLLAVFGVGSALAQSGLIWAPSRIQPEFGKVSPLKGWRRLVSGHALVEFAKGLLKSPR